MYERHKSGGGTSHVTLLGPSKGGGTGESGRLDGNSWGKTSSLQRWKHIGRALLVFVLPGRGKWRGYRPALVKVASSPTRPRQGGGAGASETVSRDTICLVQGGGHVLFAPNPAFCQPMLAPVGTKLRPRPHYGPGSLRNIRDVLLALRMRVPSCRQSQSGPECRPVSRAGAAGNCGPS